MPNTIGIQPRRASRTGMFWLALASLLTVGPTLGTTLGASGSTVAASDGKTEIQWVEGKLDPVLAKARERNAPLVIFALLNGEQCSEKLRSHLAGNGTLAKGLAGTVAMFASDGEPPPGAKLAKQKELMDEVYNRWIAESSPDGAWALPEVLLVAPDGTVTARLGSGHIPSDDDILDAVAKLVKTLGPAVDEATVPKLAALRDAGRQAKLAGEAMLEWHAWRELLSLTTAGPFADEANVALPLVEATLLADIANSGKEVTEANLAGRCGFLRRVVRHGRGSALEKPAQTEVNALLRNKAVKSLIPPLALEEDAEDLLHDAEAALATRDEARAKRSFKLLAAKKFSTTSAAQRARASHAERMQG